MESRTRSILDRAGAAADDAIDLVETALALSAVERPRVKFDWYREHLRRLVADVAERATVDPPAAAMGEVLTRRWGYIGDAENYDDPQNADLMRVIDRRRGLPVALGILYIHVARAQGWRMEGLDFPNHFLVRLEADGVRTVLDPFHGGMTRDATSLRALLKVVAGLSTELSPRHYEALDNRSILLRLQNNLKVRHLMAGSPGRALAVVETMQRIAPRRPDLWREAGLLQARLGNLRAAIDALSRFLAAPAVPDRQRHEAAAMLQSLEQRLN
jgi:regulator of sirC expression with transglutaminase-like and TPR domain